MKTILLRNDSIVIEEEKKGLFSTKKITREILAEDIVVVRREEYQGNLNSMTIILGDNKEEFLIAEECPEIEGLYQFIIKQRELGKKIKITKIDIETLEENEI